MGMGLHDRVADDHVDVQRGGPQAQVGYEDEQSDLCGPVWQQWRQPAADSGRVAAPVMLTLVQEAVRIAVES